MDIQDLCINLCNSDMNLKFIEGLLVRLMDVQAKCEIGEELSAITECIKLVSRKRHFTLELLNK